MSLLERLGFLRRQATIGDVRPEHAERLAQIHALAFARPWVAADFLDFLSDRAIRIDALYLGRDERPAGFVVSRITLDEAEILSVALDRSARGEGHSRQMLGIHLAHLAQAGVERVHLEVEEGNRPAIALYRGAGFVQSGTRRGYYTRPDGSRTNALSMTRLMPGAKSGGGQKPGGTKPRRP